MLLFRLLGPLEVRDRAGASVLLVRRKQRELLVLLLLHAGRAVSTDEIVEALWHGRPPASARANLYSYVSELRRMLAGVRAPGSGPRLRTVGSGYQLDFVHDECDTYVFEDLAERGRQAVAEGRHAAAAECLARALGLWRGAALEGLDAEWARPFLARLEQARLHALENQIDARLVLGQHEDLAVELSSVVERHPLHEPLWGRFMVALHGCGHRVAALTAYRRLCARLDAELGVGPSLRLRELHRTILTEAPVTSQNGPVPGVPVPGVPVPGDPVPR